MEACLKLPSLPASPEKEGYDICVDHRPDNKTPVARAKLEVTCAVHFRSKSVIKAGSGLAMSGRLKRSAETEQTDKVECQLSEKKSKTNKWSTTPIPPKTTTTTTQQLYYWTMQTLRTEISH